MKKIFALILSCILAPTLLSAQTARQVLDKAAAVVSQKQGVTATFTMKAGQQTTSGTLKVKGRRFCATTPEATVWFDGKTQWTYMKQSDEVNVSTPSERQLQAMNPYTFINMYKKGYKLSMTTKGNMAEVHCVADAAKKKGISEMYITVNQQNNQPTEVRMLNGKQWTTFTITSLKAQKLADNVFTFNAKDFPTAEVIDLR